MYIDLFQVSTCARALARLRARLGGVLLILGLGLILEPVVARAFEFEKTPAKPVPAARWGALQPGGILGDTTYFAFHRDPGEGEPFWTGVDIENGWLFAVTGRGFQVYDANSNPDSPPRVAYGYGPTLMPVFYHSDEDFFLKDVDAPPGIDTLAAVAGWGQGFVVWNTSQKSGPTVHYQDDGVQAVAVYSAILGGTPGTPYAFAAASGGVYYYDLNVAKTKTKCLDHSAQNDLACGGVYKGRAIPADPNPDGGVIHGAGNFLAVAKIAGSGFEIWNIATLPGSPAVKVMSGAQAARGIAMWQAGSSYYLAVGNLGKLYIYDVSCIAGGSCAAPAPLKVLDVPNGIPGLSRVTVSKTGGGVPYLYMAGSDISCKPQTEYLFDVSNPANPVDISPKVHPDGYWGWYYEQCATGFNWVNPVMGKFYGGNFYRAASGVLDVHKLALALPPTASFTWSPATEIYPGTQVQFTDQSSGSPTAWSWTFTGGQPEFSSEQNPTVAFNTTGDKTVSLTSTNAQGPGSPVSKTVTVLDPAPKIGGVTVSPASPVVCQPITFTATGVTGQPALAYSWDLPGAAPAPSPTNANPLVWNTTASTSPGIYTATVTVSNGHGNAQKSAQVTVGALTAINPNAAPANDPFTAGTVKFHDNQPGGSATEWSWDFDDDENATTNNWTAWTNDPVNGPAPTHTYTDTGIKNVYLRVKNCTTPDQANGIMTGPLQINIAQITPLVAGFRINATGACFGNECILEAGVSYTFTDESTGAEAWWFDWNGDNTFEQGPLGPTDPAFTVTDGVRTIQHSFPQTATPFRPMVKVTRGAEEKISSLVQMLVVGPSTPGVINIGGPSSGQPNQALSFVAAGGGSCNPAADGWTWSTSGGTGADNTASASITWSSTGTKTITVTNSACSGVSGSKTVTIGSDPPPPPPPPPPPGGLKADFTFSPGAPIVNQTVSFNGATSTGNPTGYAWDFGDGSPLALGAQVTHTFTTAGSRQVQLTVTGPGVCPPAPFCSATTAKTVVVGTGEAPLIPAFTTSANCGGDFGFGGGADPCSATAGQTVTFDDQSQGNPTTWTWDFGDGSTATGKNVSHVFTQGGSLNVTLTVGRGSSTATTSKPFNIAEPTSRSIVLPWIAQTRGALLQSSDLYVHNPGTTAMEVTLEFRKKGSPETNPPRATKTIGPGATFYVADVLKELFDKENIAGFITLTVDEGVAPVITSFNTTFNDDGKEFGQTVAGVSMVSGTSAAEDQVQHLVGLIDNEERLAYFGVSNPSDETAVYKLRFFDRTGQQIGGDSQDFILSRFGQKQFQSKEIHDDFGVSNVADYRVEIETKSGGHLVPYASNLRLSSEDPSFILAGAARAATVYLIGVLSTPGLNNSLWQTDALLSNPSGQPISLDVTFTGLGLNGTTTPPLHVTLAAGETRRLENVIDGQWGIKNGIGVLTLTTTSGGAFPLVQGESYDNTDPEKRFGQSMMAVSDAGAAGAGQGQYLVGLRQDADNRTTFWLFNPGSETAEYDLVYRRLDGTPLGSPVNVRLGAGKMRQFSPNQHPLPAEGVADGFAVQILVKSGKVLGAAQVINNLTNDPAYIQGEVR